MLRSTLLQRWVLGTHTQAFERLLAAAPPIRHVVIVGGGLFPRTAIVLRRLLPGAQLTIVDASAANLERARAFLQDERIQFVHARFRNRELEQFEINLKSELCNLKCALLVFPLSFDGDRSAVYARPPAATVIVHDWLWHKRGASRIVSPLLLKRVNLVRACQP